MSNTSDTTQFVMDRLMNEYLEKSGTYELAVDICKAIVEYELLELRSRLRPYERLEVVGRVKSFQSAFKKLQSQQEGRLFDPDRLELYTLDKLGDMAGIKIRVFPNSHFSTIHELIRRIFPRCEEDHNPPMIGSIQSEEYFNNVDRLKYFTKVPDKYDVSCSCEIQVVPWILDRYWEIEHEILYKPDITISRRMQLELKDSDLQVVNSIKGFMSKFTNMLQDPSYVKQSRSEKQ